MSYRIRSATNDEVTSHQKSYFQTGCQVLQTVINTVREVLFPIHFRSYISPQKPVAMVPLLGMQAFIFSDPDIMRAIGKHPRGNEDSLGIFNTDLTSLGKSIFPEFTNNDSIISSDEHHNPKYRQIIQTLQPPSQEIIFNALDKLNLQDSTQNKCGILLIEILTNLLFGEGFDTKKLYLSIKDGQKVIVGRKKLETSTSDFLKETTSLALFMDTPFTRALNKTSLTQLQKQCLIIDLFMASLGSMVGVFTHSIIKFAAGFSGDIYKTTTSTVYQTIHRLAANHLMLETPEGDHFIPKETTLLYCSKPQEGRDNLIFGSGIHFCPGQKMAKWIVESTLQCLGDHYDRDQIKRLFNITAAASD
jgi:hypothetical protein